MIKVRYNEKTGQLLKRYPANIIVPEPYIEITREKANLLYDLPKDKAWFYINGEFVINDNPDYVAEQVKTQKRQALIDYFESFYPELKALFKPAKDAVLEYLDKGEFETALRVMEKYPLPMQTFIDDEGNERSLEEFRQHFISLLRGEE